MGSTSSRVAARPKQSEQSDPYPPLVHFAFVSGILLPLVVVPYLLGRRNATRIYRSLDETNRTIKGLHRELQVTKLELDKVKAQQMQETMQRKQEAQKIVEDVTTRHDKLKGDSDQGQKALLENVASLEKNLESFKVSQSQSMEEVGRSLGTVAQFMHEVELKLGLGGRKKDTVWIDGLRAPAARLIKRDWKDLKMKKGG